MERLDKERFEKNPSLFLEQAIKEYVRTSPSNRLPAFNNEPIFDEPLVGFVNGDAPIFQDYKSIIGDFHLTPREFFAKHLEERGNGGEEQPPCVSAIIFVVPFNYETRLSMHQESRIPSVRWNHARIQGQDHINDVANYVVSLLRELGYQAVFPEQASFFKVTEEGPGARVSNWSLRHVAYAAGLGTFSLNDTFITPRGITMRLGSVVSNVALEPSPRIYDNHLANYLFYRDKSCRRCIERCPAGAVSEQGRDKVGCLQFMRTELVEMAKQLGITENYINGRPTCGFCQTNVPCEAKIPLSGGVKGSR